MVVATFLPFWIGSPDCFVVEDDVEFLILCIHLQVLRFQVSTARSVYAVLGRTVALYTQASP